MEVLCIVKINACRAGATIAGYRGIGFHRTTSLVPHQGNRSVCNLLLAAGGTLTISRRQSPIRLAGETVGTCIPSCSIAVVLVLDRTHSVLERRCRACRSSGETLYPWNTRLNRRRRRRLKACANYIIEPHSRFSNLSHCVLPSPVEWAKKAHSSTTIAPRISRVQQF